MFTRWSKIVLVFSISFFSAIVVFNNLTDYSSNYQFVNHVLLMDTTFPGNNGMWRAISSPFLHHTFYIGIILTEFLVAALCGIGAFKLFSTRGSAESFHQAKGLSICGLTLGVILWFIGFIVVGGEWFLMWQSKTWNGQQAAFRLVVIIGFTLLYLVRPDQDNDA